MIEAAAAVDKSGRDRENMFSRDPKGSANTLPFGSRLNVTDNPTAKSPCA
jgi:hypothetical protein